MTRFCLMIAAVLLTASLRGQNLPDNLFFEHLSIPGTIQSAVTEDIFQDPHGMLWIAKDALYRFNGRDFHRYDMIFPDSALFSAREITRITWDQNKDRLLIGTRNYGVIQYDYETDQIRRIPSRDGIPIISDIQAIGNEVWVTSFTSGLFKLVNDTLVKDRDFTDFHNPTEMVVAKGVLWIGCTNEVIGVKNNQIARRVSLSAYNEYYPNTIRSSALMFDHLGHLWVGTERDGLLVVDTTDLSTVKRFSPKVAPFYNAITSIAQDRSNLVWVTTKGGGIVLYSPETDSYKQVHKTDADEGTLSGENITSLCIDRTDIVWVGTAGDINKYDRNKIKFKHYYHDPKNPNSLSDDNIRNIYEDEQGIIYVATSAGYINTIDRKKNKIESYKARLSDSQGLLIPLSVLPYKNNTMLVGSSEGVLQFDKQKKTFTRFKPLEALTRNRPVRQIINKGNDFSMMAKQQIVTFNDQTGVAKLYDESPVREINASCLVSDNQNRLWVGTKDGVIYRNAGEEKFKLIRLEHDADRPDSSFFLPLSLQPIGNELWVNSFNNGIFIIDLMQDPPRLTEKITTIDGLPDNTVYASIPDETNGVWISHNSGLSRYDLQTHEFVHFTVAEGLQDEEFNRLAFFKSPSGEIMLGGINGLNIFDPRKITLPALQSDIQLVDVSSYGSKNTAAVRSLISNPGQVELTYSNNTLQFSYFVADFHAPVRYKLRYRLEPFESAWVETDALTSKTYSNLSPGTYTFTSRITSSAGVESSDRVTIIITPPYWQTWWFFTLAGVVVCFLVFSIIQSSIQSTRREKLRLEELLKIRTREIEQSREELENLNRKKDLIFSILSHDLRSPLTTLKGFLGLLIDNSDALSKQDLQKYATNIRNSVTTSLDLIDNTLFWSLSQTGNIQCVPTQLPLSPIFEKVKGLYQLTAEKKHLTMHFPQVNGIAVFADENMVYVLLRNLVSNAIKFTPEMNSIRVDAQENGDDVMITVKDAGVGMTSEEISKIFLFDNPMVKKGTSSEKGTGLGLLLCKKFVELNKGKLLIESKVGVGSTFTVVLPKATLQFI